MKHLLIMSIFAIVILFFVYLGDTNRRFHQKNKHNSNLIKSTDSHTNNNFTQPSPNNKDIKKEILKTKILICYFGGTIGEIIKDVHKGLQPVKGVLSNIVKNIIKGHPTLDINYHIYEDPHLIDSSNSRIDNINRYAKTLYDNKDNYDGFIILHGTDSMAYTASFLTFILGKFDKPILMTGSQDPAVNLRNDAFGNIKTCLSLVKDSFNTLPKKLLVVFGEFINRGVVVSKVSSMSYNGFQAPNTLPLAKLGSSIEWRKDVPLGNSRWNETLLSNQLNLFNSNLKIPIIWISPSFDLKLIENYNPDAIIFVFYGAGNGPDILLDYIKKLISKNIPCIITSQCHNRYVDMSIYQAGKQFLDLGVISSYNMTIEAILAKVYYLLSIGNKDLTTFKKFWKISLCGELDYTPNNLFVQVII